ncbi:MAG TPA: hypothetical protein VEO54_06475 [Thermoanaerobaculia bacterium]|nr:hypothetical protein [Thermoanaerobaculia bacterium]
MTRHASRSFPALLLLLLFASTALARDAAQRTTPRAVFLNHTHSGSSPFPPPDADDTLFVVDSGSGLDTGCTFRGGGPLQIRIPIRRAVGNVDASGHLLDPAGFKARGLISPFAKLIIPVFDIDMNGSPGFPPEVDRVEFNGHDLGTLTGGDGIWKLNEFSIPIEWIRFPRASMGGPAQDEPTGAEPAPVENTVTISIDQASGPAENWCMAVDWAHLELKAIAPIFAVHGIAAQSDTWETDFKTHFESIGLPFTNKVDLIANGSVAQNAPILGARLNMLARSFGAKKYHVVAHSKGGLDTRLFTNSALYDPKTAKLLSVSTLSTPHHGSVLADILVATRTENDPQSSDADIQRIIRAELLPMFSFPPQDPGILDLKTDRAAIFNTSQPLRGDIQWWGWGANADANGNGIIDAPAETAPMIPGSLPDGYVSKLATATYKVLGSVEKVKVTQLTSQWGLNEYTTIEKDASIGFFVGNDLAVNTLSAFPPPGGSFMGSFPANHTTIRGAAAAQSILIQITNQFPNH